MTTITADTLGDKGLYYLRDVLATNITTATFFDTLPENYNISSPHVIMELVSCPSMNINLDSATTRSGKTQIIIGLEIWTYGESATEIRDGLASSIVSTLKDSSNVDSNGDSITSKYLKYKNSDMSNVPITYLENYPKPFRVKTMTVTLSYRGA